MLKVMLKRFASPGSCCAAGVFLFTFSGRGPYFIVGVAGILILAAGIVIPGLYYAYKLRRLKRQIGDADKRARDSERQRDSIQEELFRRLYEQRELDREKMQFHAQLSEYEKYAALAQLALGAAHEINNPLLGILSHLELELKSGRDPANRQEVEQCIAGTKRISATLQGLVNYARPSPPLLSRISLARLVSDTVAFLENQPMLHGRTLENRVPADTPLLRADANQLSQVLMNLLLNAAEATPEGGRITISAQKLTYVESLEIRVMDTGSGIPPDVLAHVLEPFFTTKRGRGTGLGLSISYAYVRSHGGDMRVDSVVGRGTTVTLTLPLRSQLPAEQEDQESQIVV